LPRPSTGSGKYRIALLLAGKHKRILSLSPSELKKFFARGDRCCARQQKISQTPDARERFTHDDNEAKHARRYFLRRLAAP
jgi:hypothetical protein